MANVLRCVCGGEAGVHTHYRSEQEEQEGEEGSVWRRSRSSTFLHGLFFLKSGEVTGGFEAQAVFSRSCMAFCCVSFSVDTHCVHNPADTCGTRNKQKVTLDFRPHMLCSSLFLSTVAHLYLTDDVGQPYAARVLALDRFVCDSVRDD